MKRYTELCVLVLLVHQCVLWTKVENETQRKLLRAVSCHPVMLNDEIVSQTGLSAHEAELFVVETELITAETNVSTVRRGLSIVDFVNHHRVEPNHFILLKWDKDGRLDLEHMNTTIQASYMAHWFGPDTQDLFVRMKTAPSPHGTVALLLNSDHLRAFDWDLLPPIPVLSYSGPAITTEAHDLTTDHKNNVYLVPNPYDHGGFNRWCVSTVQSVAVDFAARNNTVVWRGNVHSRTDETSRLQLLEVVAVEHNNSDWLDAKSTNAESGQEEEISMEDMVQYKYQIDIGGLSGTSWGGMRWKMCSGSLVFKVDTWSEDWWHDKIRPWKEYIPIKDDLSDLHAMWQWAEQHPEETLAIARAGKEACDLTLSEEYLNDFLAKAIQSLPPADEEQEQEADAILDAVVPFSKDAFVSSA